MISRPPAYRRIVRGSASRNAAMVRSASRPSITGRSPNGVPGRGLRKLSGTSSGASSAELPGELGPLLDGLAHADDAAAADLHAGVPDHLAGSPSAPPRCAW